MLKFLLSQAPLEVVQNPLTFTPKRYEHPCPKMFGVPLEFTAMHLCQISMCQYIGSQTILPPRVNCSPWPLICSLVAYWDFTKFHSRKAKCLVHASCVSRCGCGVGGGGVAGPGAPFTYYFTHGGPRDFFQSEILAKGIF